MPALVLTIIAVVIITTAILVGIGRALIPHAEQLRPWLEQEASELLGQAVTFERVEAEWPRLTPSLSLIGVQLDDGAGHRLRIDRARLEIHLPNLLDRRANLVRLVLLGLELVLEPDEDGRWGAQLGAGAAGDWRQQLPLGDLLIRDAMVRIRPLQWPEILLQLDQGSLERRGQQTQFQGALSRPGGEERLDLRLVIDHPDDQWHQLQGWLAVQGLVLPGFADLIPGAAEPGAGSDGRLELQLWLDWQLNEERLDLELDLSAALAARQEPIRARARIESVQGTLNLEVAELWHGDVSIGSGLAAARRVRADQTFWAVAVDALDLGAFHAAFAPWVGGQAYWPVELEGQVERLMLAADAELSLHAARGRLVDLNMQMNEPLPGISSLDVELALDGDRLALKPGGQPTLRWRRHIRADMVLGETSGRLLLAPGSIELQGLAVDGPVAQATADGWVYLHRPRPFLDFIIDVHRVGPTDPRPYLSYRTIPEPAMKWLDQSFVWIEQASGLVNLHLSAGTRARDLRPGSYQALVDFQGVRLDYWPDWPRADAVDGQVAFVGNRLSGTVERARFGALELSAPMLEIPELTAPTLTVLLQADGVDAGALAAVLGEIPVPGWQAVLEPLRWSGPVDASSRLLLPFRAMTDWDIAGEISLDRTALALAQPALGFDALSGRLAFDRRGLAPAVLQARLSDQVFDLSAAARFEAPAWLALDAVFNPADLDVVKESLGALTPTLDGASRWVFRLEGAAPGAEPGLQMTLESDLQGLAMGWPAPLDKSAERVWPSAARMVLGSDRQALAFHIGDVLAGRWTGAPAGWALGLAAGPQPVPELPAQGVRIAGQVEHLALGDWLTYLGDLPVAAPAPDLGTFDLALAVGRLELQGLTAQAVELAVQRRVDGWLGRIDSPEIAGSVKLPVPLNAGRAVIVDFSRLHLPRAPPADAIIPPGGPADPESVSLFDPRGLPPLSLAVEDLRWGDLALGRARLQAHSIDTGLEVELIDVSGPDLRLQGSGRWVATEAGPQSQLLGRLTSPSLSALVRAAGYEAGLEAARAQVDLDVIWPGAPQDFALRRLVGALDLSLDDGEIPEARPGAGRLLGLVSFNAIPRRLMLDFRDVFAAGLRFDAVEGRFALGGGFAVTDGLVLRSTSAVVTITGQTDMAARRYDQQVLVEPGFGATLPVIGGLAGGPVGAAAGLVLRQLLDRPLRGLAEVRYQVSGPWDAPEIELVDARLPDEPVGDDAARTSPP